MLQNNSDMAEKSSFFSKGVRFGQSPCSASCFTVFSPKFTSVQSISAVAFGIKIVPKKRILCTVLALYSVTTM